MSSKPELGHECCSATEEQNVAPEHLLSHEEQPQEPQGLASPDPESGQGEQILFLQHKPLPSFSKKQFSVDQNKLQAPVQEQQGKKEIQTLDLEELGTEFKQKSVISLPFPPQPQIGNLGRLIKLISNFYELKIPSGYVYHYVVCITKQHRLYSISTKKNRVNQKVMCNQKVMSLLLETNQHFSGLFPAYDGRQNLYTRKPLKCDFPLNCKVTVLNEKPGNLDVPHRYDVQIKPVVQINTNSCAINLDSLHAFFEKRTAHVPQETIMAVGTVLLYGSYLRFISIRYNFFYPPNPEDQYPLGEGFAVWFGHHQSLRLGESKPMVNIDVTAAVFYRKGPVLNCIAELMNTTVEDLRKLPHITAVDVRKITSALKNLSIETNFQRFKRKYHIIGLVKDSANSLKVDLKENDKTVKITIAEYFYRQFNIQLEFPHLPLLQLNPESRKGFLPIEVCDIIEGQCCRKKLCIEKTVKRTKFTTLPPCDKFNKIREVVYNRTAFKHDQHIKEFGFEVSHEPITLEGRVLDAPNLRYKDGVQIKPIDGLWNMKKINFFRGAEIISWVLLSLAQSRSCTKDDLDKFACLLVKIGQENGISIHQPSHIEIVESRRYDMKHLLTTMKDNHKADLAVMVVPGINSQIYDDIKIAETEVGLITQCVRSENISGKKSKCGPQLVSNLCQKINAKMGGINNSLMPGGTPSVLRKPVIIIGAYALHSDSYHSIAQTVTACVGSLDCYPSRYATTWRVQNIRNYNRIDYEIIIDLKEMVFELLTTFYLSTNGRKPEKIIFYRNGVGQGQFDKVKCHEVKCIREACKQLSADYMPGITFILVQKSHHIHFMPDNSKDGVGKMKNIPPGTIVDTTVTHPGILDFFLCSHFGLQGTSHPTHYIIIEDDNKFSSEDLQKLTYYLCYTYVRCTKSISRPAPVQYARLAARRIRQYLVSQLNEIKTSTDDYDSLPQVVIDAVKTKDNLKNTMFYV